MEDSRAVALLRAHPSIGENSGKLEPWSYLKDSQAALQVEVLFPSVFSAHITLGREDPCASGLFQGLPVTFKLFISRV